MEYKYNTFFKLFNTLVDYVILNACLFFVFYFYIAESLTSPTTDANVFYLLLVNLLWFYASTQTNLYDKILNTEAVPLLKKSIWSIVVFSLIPLVINLFFPRLLFTFQDTVVFLVSFTMAFFAWKVLFLSVRKSQRRFWIDYKKVVILGSGSACKELAEYFAGNSNSGYIIRGYFCDDASANIPSEFEYLGKIEDSVEYSKQNGVSEIFSTLPSSKIHDVRKLMKDADHNLIRFRLVPDISAFLDKNVLVEYYGALPVLSPRREPLEIKINEVLKQTFDYIFSGIVVIFLLSWMIPFIAAAIKIDSRGPVFFRQLRSGKDNKPFFCLKFRSMYINSDSDQIQASRGDKRITRVGSFLRKTNLDEFPQFFNVIMGDMSIVGPRPHMLKHTEDYSQLVNQFMVRQFLTPGITGWAQVNGLRGETKETESMSRRVKADIWYLENWSLLLDLKIVFLTVWQSFRRNENAF